MINNYETMYIIRPDITEEQVSQEVKKYEDFLNSRGAEAIKIQNHGKKRLAYTINKKHNDGIYVQMNYRIDGSVIEPLQRDMRISENVIRFLTLKVDKPPEVAAKPEPSTEVATPQSKPASEVAATTEAAAEQAGEEMMASATEQQSPVEEPSQ